MAAGFSLNEDKLDEFKNFVGEYIKSQLGDEKITPIISLDGSVALSGANEKLADALEQLEPFGASNPEPKIIIENVYFVNPFVIGSGHVRCLLADETGQKLKAIAFRATDTQVGKEILASKGERFDVAGILRKDTWQGRTSLQFIIEDIMRA